MLAVGGATLILIQTFILAATHLERKTESSKRLRWFPVNGDRLLELQRGERVQAAAARGNFYCLDKC